VLGARKNTVQAQEAVFMQASCDAQSNKKKQTEVCKGFPFVVCS